MFTNGHYELEYDGLSTIELKMSQGSDSVLYPWEAEAIIEHMKATNLESMGTKTWFECHRQLIQLSQQSTFEISSMREETIKEWFVHYQKIPILIHESIQISIWKQKVFPLLIELNGEPANTFMIYSIFYHENISVSLMENLLFHYDSLESLDDSVLDLIDYSVNNITSIIFADESKNVQSPTTSCISELVQKKSEMEFHIGIMSISIIGYLAGFAEKLSISVLKRLLTTHDVPYLFIQLIENRPWKGKNANGDDIIYTSSWGKPKPHEEDKICKAEGQVWIGLRELLLNPKCAPYYEITDFRLSQLNKLQKQMHEKILDQISPLIDLRRWLSCLNISPLPAEPKPIIGVEIIPKVRSSIMERYRKKWKKLARLQAESLYNKDIQFVQNMARILSSAYDFDKLDLNDTNMCAQCNHIASKRCSKCKSVWYCGRECQVKNWSAHKSTCDKMVNHNLDDTD